MQQRKTIAIGASLLLCAALFAPQAVNAAKSKSSDKTTISKIKNSKIAKSSSSNRESSGKSRLKAEKKSINDRKKLSRKAEKKATDIQAKNVQAKDMNVAASERDIWLKRARNSEALTGKASWYGKDFHNKATASGLTYDMHTFTAAHRTLPMGTVVKVTDQHNGKSVMVCVTDRGPYVPGRIIDVSYAAAAQIGLQKRGVGKVQLEVVSDETGAPLQKDKAYFVKYASAGGKSKVGPFHAFADAAAMQEALRQAHPEAEVILDKTQK